MAKMKPFLNVEAGIQSVRVEVLILRMALINLQSYTTISEPPESLGNCIATRTRFDDANGSPKPTGFDANRTLSEPSVLDSLAVNYAERDANWTLRDPGSTTSLGLHWSNAGMGFDALGIGHSLHQLHQQFVCGHLHSMRTTLFRKIVENQRKT
ncbi:hypothetical protein ACOSQ2_006117 [Xanthoceras sorbifolium]